MTSICIRAMLLCTSLPLAAAALQCPYMQGRVPTSQARPAVHPATPNACRMTRSGEISCSATLEPSAVAAAPVAAEMEVDTSALQALRLLACRKLTALPDLSSLSSLREVSVRGCSQLAALPDLSALSSLQTLDLDSCETLTTLPDLSALSSLQEINLQWCSSLTAEAKAAAKRQLPAGAVMILPSGEKSLSA